MREKSLERARRLESALGAHSRKQKPRARAHRAATTKNPNDTTTTRTNDSITPARTTHTRSGSETHTSSAAAHTSIAPRGRNARSTLDTSANAMNAAAPKFTRKVQEYIQAAAGLATEDGHSELSPWHLAAVAFEVRGCCSARLRGSWYH